ncbi:MAG: hypothetical protein ACTSQH_06765 [Candidatus Hodarchaeales archaeon]
MSINSKRIRVGSFLCFLICISFISGVSVVTSVDESPIIVLFDESHGQFFNQSLYSHAIADLEDLGMQIVFNTEILNENTFEGVDVFISTNPDVRFEFSEREHIKDFLSEGKGLLLLANPLSEENDSINGNGNYLNEILQNLGFGISARFWTEPDPLGSEPLNDIVKNVVDNAGIPEYLQLDITDTENAIFTDYQNVSSVITTSCSISTAVPKLIVASNEAYAETPMKERHSLATEIVVLASAGDNNDFEPRTVLGGSSNMFSDLYNPILQSTWYESADNAKLWTNIVSWLAEASQETSSPPALSELFLPFVIGTSTIAIFLIIGGIFLYMVGSGRITKVVTAVDVRVKKTKKEKTDSETLEKEQPTVKATKRDRRLTQIKKDKKTGKRP